jgi:hypothetical protein
VRLMKAGKPVVTVVAVGAKGAAFTQVTNGVSAGDVIALAELSASLPASSGELTTTNRFGAGAGGFGGAPPGGGTFGGTGGAGGTGGTGATGTGSTGAAPGGAPN